ncbi:MAG: hypothetical protein A2508_06240 [Candidatus Lambdaproteobacteria bacterium RIFOXYD12_FULL_49_8]|uniref:ATPase AAA-type core domain-containing protein n=1 Tax=Candidatus Lambdaproteobacteria bacterium RIFOXYD2_FULL_50_16 TaxID=1817772 RepID=A0A1F6GEW4_9PROT|nr:MAG: hypothetical protein A2527_03615 [Candidatus Lambdaproteobacteria bacterium RIFOXYD2_FULL_50_16]OGG98378.1 MAG: hypothetical protein A2508_06240 [Candidatus Lambdaproteobacteria bacterium RIFOXYD12_FULL_49_8]
MLVDFTVANYRSFNQPQTFSMIADSTDELPDNLIKIHDDLFLLRSAAIYGANASGKSNLLKAMDDFASLIVRSADSSRIDRPIREYQPFLFNAAQATKPTHFEIRVVSEETIYRYGVEFTGKKVVGEWLYQKAGKKKEQILFERENQTFQLGQLFKAEGSPLQDKVRENALFLSVCAQFKGEISTKTYFSILCHFISEISVGKGFFRNANAEKIHSRPEFKQSIVALLKSCDIHIADLLAEPKSEAQKKSEFLDPDKPANNYLLVHTLHDNSGQQVGQRSLPLEEESEGTQRLFDLGLLFESHKFFFKSFLVDELDDSLHPLLQENLVRLFHERQREPKQLIFTTHSTEILTNKLFRRDQIWFTEKDELGATELYSLLEIKGVRKDLSYGKNYLLGRFGAIPKVTPFEPSDG